MYMHKMHMCVLCLVQINQLTWLFSAAGVWHSHVVLCGHIQRHTEQVPSGLDISPTLEVTLLGFLFTVYIYCIAGCVCTSVFIILCTSSTQTCIENVCVCVCVWQLPVLWVQCCVSMESSNLITHL